MSAWGSMSSEAEDPMRTCADCGRAKTIRGVWYLFPGRAMSPFVCETCFVVVRSAAVRA